MQSVKERLQRLTDSGEERNTNGGTLAENAPAKKYEGEELVGDCFSYAAAKATGEPLLFKGSEFSKTDLFTVPI